MVINIAEGYLLSTNIINLIDYKSSIKNNEWSNDHSNLDEVDLDDLEDPVMIGWTRDRFGEKTLHITSSVDTVCCLWMIDLARKIVESRPPEIRNDDE
jgi:hypothetical protein